MALEHAVRLIISTSHPNFSMKDFGLLDRMRLAKIKRLIDAHAREGDSVGLEVASKRSLYTMANKALAEDLVEGRRVFDIRDREQLATIIARWLALEGVPSVGGSRNPIIVDRVNRYNSFNDFRRDIERGFYSFFEAIRLHAESRDLNVLPLDDPNLRAKSFRRTIELLSQAHEDPLKGFELRQTMREDPDVAGNRNVHMMGQVTAGRPNIVVVGTFHGNYIADNYKHQKQVELLSPVTRIMRIFGKL